MLHLVMKQNNGDGKSLFTGRAYAKGAMAERSARTMNREGVGFFYTQEIALDIGGFDGTEDLPEGYNEVFLVMMKEGSQNFVAAAFSDQASAELVCEGKNAFSQDAHYWTEKIKVIYPQDRDDDLSVGARA